MFEYLIDLPFSEFKKEVMKIFKKNLQTPDKIEWERKIMNSEGEVLGVKSNVRQEIRKVAWKRKNSWNEIEKLWGTEICEFRYLATEMLHKAKKSDKEKLDLLFKLTPKALHWGDTDGLIVHEMKDVIRRNPQIAFDYSQKKLNSKNKWERRMSMVILIPLTDEGGAGFEGKYIPKILKLAKKLLKDPENYVQKAVSWAIKQGHRHSQDKIFAFLKKHAKTKDKNQIKIIRLAMEYQTPERKQELRNIIKECNT